MSEVNKIFDGLYVLAEVASIVAADDRLLDQQTFPSPTTTGNRATPLSTGFMDSVPKKKRSCFKCKQPQAVTVEKTSDDTGGNSYHHHSEQKEGPKFKKQRTNAMGGSDHKTRPIWFLHSKSPMCFTLIKAT